MPIKVIVMAPGFWLTRPPKMVRAGRTDRLP
jgi:hypothetical protein